MEYIFGGIIFTLILYIGVREFLYHRTIVDLTKKIMAKDLTDYTVATEKTTPIKEDKPNEDLVELDEGLPQPLTDEEDEDNG